MKGPGTCSSTFSDPEPQRTTQSLAKKKMALDAYYEAVDLADLAYDELDEDDPIYKRYFRSNDFQLVKGKKSMPLRRIPFVDSRKRFTDRSREPLTEIEITAALTSQKLKSTKGPATTVQMSAITSEFLPA